MSSTHKPKIIEQQYQVVVIGGGLAGVCAAISAARLGIKTVLVHDRPVLGGNSSQEITVPVGGADHFGNYRYSRETGIIDELFSEEAQFNPFNSKSLWSILLWSFCKREKNLTLFLNTFAKEPEVKDNCIQSILAEQYTTEKTFKFRAKIFIDCSGDGRVAYESGAKFMRGQESRSQFGESLAVRKTDDYTMGSSIHMHVRDTGKPVRFTPPPWAYDFPKEVFDQDHPDDISYLTSPTGGYWWTDTGGKLDTISDAEEIRDALLRYTFGVWDHIKNHGEHGAENYVLESINVIPGKRESRRFTGDYILTQRDVETLRCFSDAVAYGGWGFDIHLPTGLKVKLPSKYWKGSSLRGRYTIPLRCLYSKNIKNLLFAGRNISATHVALGSTRVMATCAVMGQAVGTASYLCLKYKSHPRKIYTSHIRELQQTLLRQDCYMPGIRNDDRKDLARQASITASSQAKSEIPAPEEYKPLERARMQSFVISEGRLDKIILYLENRNRVPVPVKLHLRKGEFIDDFRSQRDLAIAEAEVPVGKVKAEFNFFLDLESDSPYWVLIHPHKNLSLGCTRHEPIGTQAGQAWAKGLSFIDRIRGSYCLDLAPKSYPYYPELMISGISRPEKRTNLWMSEPGFPQWIELQWKKPVTFNTIYLTFDNNLDRNLRRARQLKIAPECIKDYRIYAHTSKGWREILAIKGNYQRHRIHKIKPLKTSKLKVEILNSNGVKTANIYEVRVYNES